MFEIAMTKLKRRFLTLKNFLWLFFMFACIQFLDEILSYNGIIPDNTIFDYLFDGIQIIIIGIGIYIFLRFSEKNVQQSLIKGSFLRAVIENMDEGVYVCDKDGNLVFFNDVPSAPLKHSTLSLPIPFKYWSNHTEFYEGKVKVKVEDLPLLRALRGEEVKHQELAIKSNGEPIQYLSVNGKQIISKSGEVLGALVVLHDITERKQSEEKVKHMAYHDNLTGLPNLRFFKEKIDQYLAEGKQRKSSELFAIMFLDLDGFKFINDNFGHDVGDLLLKEVGQRITHCLRKNDLVARIGGDEFTILLPGLKTENEAISIANTIIDMVASPYEIKGNKLHVTTSIGINFSSHHDTDRRILMKNADIAMYKAKKSGKNQYCVFQYEKISS